MKNTKTGGRGPRAGNIKARAAFLFVISILIFSSMGMVLTASASTGIINAAETAFESGFCGGSQGFGGLYGGLIPASNVLAGHGKGEQSLLDMSVFIMLTLVLVGSVIYIVGYVLALENVKNMAKAEFGEILVTAIVVFIFIGGFNLASIGANPQNVFHAAGNNFGRQTYVDDCMYMTGTSMGLILPLFVAGRIQWFMDLVESFQVNLNPAYFGPSFAPFLGYNLFDTMFGILTTVGWGMVLMVLAITVLLGFIFAFFPVFLYAGIVLRSLPWTRAAGGAFLGLFVGFYIVFPLLLHVMLSGYASTTSGYTSLLNNQVVTQAGIASGLTAQSRNGASATAGYLSNLVAEVEDVYDIASSGTFGIVNGFVLFVIEPAAFTVFAIVFALIISFDFAEIAGRLLGAPNLSAGMMVGRLKGLS